MTETTPARAGLDELDTLLAAATLGEPHRVDWTIDNAQEPRARFTCTAPVGALCRSWCTEPSCEESCELRDRDGREHVWEPLDYCRITTWLENGGTPGELFYGEDGEPLRSGPIETEWDGDGYLWQYASDPLPEGAIPAMLAAIRAAYAQHVPLINSPGRPPACPECLGGIYADDPDEARSCGCWGLVTPICSSCADHHNEKRYPIQWPCPTVAALDEALGASGE